MLYSNKLALFLLSAMILLSGAETEGDAIFGGTLPLRGDGTLPLRMPSDGTLPLIMSGIAAVSTQHEAGAIAMSIDVELAAGSPEATQVACAEVFGPIWQNISGSGVLLVGESELTLSDTCVNKLTQELALIAVARESSSPVSCFLTTLWTIQDGSAVSGELTCTDAVAGANEHVFRLVSQQ